ncbi:MAG: Ppx/GppA family phosphatase, partial [Halanaerobiales bacterium]
EKTVDSILKKLRLSSWEERKAIKGLQPERADIITAGTIILSVIMKEMKIEKCVVSEYDILYGLLLEISEKISC